MKRLLVFFILATALAGHTAIAGNLGPEIPKATGKPHPEGNLWMRINHPKMLLHDRNLTMRQGDRDIEFSLKGCVSCHAVKGADGQPVGYDDPKYFCRVCHDYAAVKVDCFMCHNSKPEEKTQAFLSPRKAPDSNELAAYLNKTGKETGQ